MEVRQWQSVPYTENYWQMCRVALVALFSYGTGTLRCLQKEMATYRHWSVSLWRDPDDVPHCRILSPDKTEWRLISTHKTISEMTYNVSSGTLNSTIPYYTYIGYTLRMKTPFRGWTVMVHDTLTRRRSCLVSLKNVWFSRIMPTTIQEQWRDCHKGAK